MKLNAQCGHLNHYNFIYVLLALTMLSSCSSNKVILDSNNVSYIHFWFVPLDDAYNIAQQDCEDIVFGDNHKDTIITDRRVIAEYIKIVNSLKHSHFNDRDLRVSSIILMRPTNGNKGKQIRVCIDPLGKVLVDGVIMRGNSKRIRAFLNDALYSHYTNDDWTPEIMRNAKKE